MELVNWSTIVANLITSLGVVSFIAFYLSHRQTQAQFRFTVMVSCIERFQGLFPIIRKDNEDFIRLRRYIDLTNEEFFYFQQEYIPKEVIVEWMDSIVEFFPIYLKGKETPINYSTLRFPQIHDENLLKGYPRLIKAFTITDKDLIDNRVELIIKVSGNLGVKLKTFHFKKANLSSGKV